MLLELMIGLVLSSVFLAMTGSLWLYGNRSLAATSKYAEPAARDCKVLRLKSPDLRPATQATVFQNSRDPKCFGLTNAAVGKATACTWKACSQPLIGQKTGQRY
jgi:hypothetical protein